LISLKHFFITLHEWVGVMFIVLIIIHVVLHWTYIKSNLKKYGMMK
jgi:hypothetical protein